MTFFILWNFLPLVVEINVPLLFKIGQYRHVFVLLQMGGMMLVWVVLVDALTSWSERFLLRLLPNVSLASARNRVVFGGETSRIC